MICTDPDMPIPLPDVPTILRRQYGRHVTRQTVWNWARKGLSVPGGRARLQVLERGRRLYTTPRWLRWFLMEGC